MCSVHLGSVLLKDEELARYLEYGKKQLLIIVVTTILTIIIFHKVGCTGDYNFQWMNLAWHFESCMTVCSRSSWAMSMAVSWTHISQDRVTTYLKCGDIFNSHFTANLLLNQTVKESIKNWWSYCHEFGGFIFLERRIHAALQTCILCFVIADRWCHIAVCLLYEWLSLGTFVSQ